MRRARGALPAAMLLLAGCADRLAGPGWPAPEEEGGRWPTWVLQSGSELRPPAPSAPSAAETEEILRLQRTPAATDSSGLARWTGLPTMPWTQEALDLLQFYWALLPDVRVASPASSARTMALLHVAMHDALVASWDAKYAYGRKPPHQADPRVRALGTTRGSVPSYPSEHAAAAAAAVAVLNYAFPGEDTARLGKLAREAGEAQIAAGLAYRSDVDVGAALGRRVAERAIARARMDGAEARWQGAVPSGADAWRPTPPRRVRVPFDPTAGRWRTWAIASGDQFRPPPPPRLGSPEFLRDVEELRRLGSTRTQAQADAARWWATDAPSARWESYAMEEIRRANWSPLRAARAQALISVAMYDAFVACWDAKFHFWLLRPVSADSTVKTVYSTPPFPSYPSGHSTVSSAAGEVFAYLFPRRADFFLHKAEEASLSRVWGGVHYRFDVVAGEELGRKVGGVVVERARAETAAR